MDQFAACHDEEALERHRMFATTVREFVEAEVRDRAQVLDETEAYPEDLYRTMAQLGLFGITVPAEMGGVGADAVSYAIVMEELARGYASVADQCGLVELVSSLLAAHGTPEQRKRYLEPLVRFERKCAYAITEPEAGSDVAAMATTATPDGNAHVRIDGEKSWISNGGIADHYVVFARTGEAPGARGLSAFLVEADTPGLTIPERIEVIAPHPLATLRFESCRVPLENRIGGPGEGFKVAMATLDIFRSTVGAAALGFARRALHETLAHANGRKLFGGTLGDLQLSQAAIADSGAQVDAAALLVYRAAWTKDHGAARVTREAALAKLVATENAQSVIDRAVQIHGGLGVTKGVKVEELYREIRALRIYEGASEVQKVVIARDLLKAHAEKAGERHDSNRIREIGA